MALSLVYLVDGKKLTDIWSGPFYAMTLHISSFLISLNETVSFILVSWSMPWCWNPSLRPLVLLVVRFGLCHFFWCPTIPYVGPTIGWSWWSSLMLLPIWTWWSKQSFTCWLSNRSMGIFFIRVGGVMKVHPITIMVLSPRSQIISRNYQDGRCQSIRLERNCKILGKSLWLTTVLLRSRKKEFGIINKS